MGKQVSIKQLEPEVNIYKEFVEIPVTINGNDEEYAIKLYPYFKPEKIKKLVNELVLFFQTAAKEKLNIPDEEQDDLIGFFMVKHFTNLKFTTSKKAVNIYKEFKIALNTSVFKTLIETFPAESKYEVMQRIFEISTTNEKLQAVIGKAQEAFKDLPLEHREMLFGNENKAK